MNIILKIRQELRKAGSPQDVKNLEKFFQCFCGGYGEGDKFLGVNVPKVRKIAKKYYKKVVLRDLKLLINSLWHEERQLALFFLIYLFNMAHKKNDNKNEKQIVEFYLKNTRFINNWDLVDCSAEKILGVYFFTQKDKRTIFKLAKSKNVWERRISVLTTFYFIKQNQFSETFLIAKTLLNDKEDLIHKAVGWMLREVGKRNQKKEEEFLKKYCEKMPRVMLRYAIEKFSSIKRKHYLERKIN